MMRKTALITGASRGIGKAVAKEFASNGYDLYLVCLNSYDYLCGYTDELSSEYHVSCTALQCDVSNYSNVEDIFKKIDDIDILVNNAGISYFGLLSDMTPDEWDKVIGTNLSSAFYFSKNAIPLMLKKKSGKIINISSVWGVAGASMETAYSASKGGMNALTKALAKELAPSNIQVNAIACGVIDTDMNLRFSCDEMRDIIDMIPAGRMGSPADVASLVYQLASGNQYLTGQIICLDGGFI